MYINIYISYSFVDGILFNYKLEIDPKPKRKNRQKKWNRNSKMSIYIMQQLLRFSYTIINNNNNN